MENNIGLCFCGCGQKTNISERTNTRLGLKKGKHSRYVCGHQNRGRYRGNANPNWKGGKINLGNGRFAVYAPKNSNSNLCAGNHILEYRIIAEEKLGRALLKNEIVHHKDGNVLNNVPENLEIMTQSEHARLHGKEKNALWAKKWAVINRKLLPKQVLEIRELYSSQKYSMLELSKQFYVSYPTIRNIVLKNSYKEIV